MSNKDRPGKSVAFYSDNETLEKLFSLAKSEHRSVSNMLTVMIQRYWDMRAPHQVSINVGYPEEQPHG